MRKQKTVKIDDKEIAIKELRVKDFVEILEGVSADTSIAALRGQIEKLLPLATDLTVESMMEMSPSELQQIYDGFREVNSVFFEGAGALGMGSLLAELKNSLLKDFSGLLAGS